MDHERYTYRVLWSEDDQEFVGLCAEFPGLSWLADTMEAALHGIAKLVRDVLVDMERGGEPIPTPICARRYSGKFQVRIPPDRHRLLALQAAEAGVSINRLINDRLAG